MNLSHENHKAKNCTSSNKTLKIEQCISSSPFPLSHTKPTCKKNNERKQHSIMKLKSIWLDQ